MCDLDILTLRTNKNIKQISSQLSDIVTILKLQDGEDATEKIQAALDKGGLVRIITPGTFLVGRLYIGSNTTFELVDGVKLKRKANTNHHIIVNKGHVTGTRDKNITIRGGIWDLNRDENPISGGNMSVDPQSNPGIGIVLRFVDGLTIENIQQIGNEWKYCFLIVDCTRLRIRDINLLNESDGIHFEPPIRNAIIENIYGFTDDDMISFTAGDYPVYSLGQTGDFENIIVRNVHGNEGTAELIKLVGSGIDGKSVFKNMRFENLSGYSDIYAVCIRKEDQSSANPTLLNTKLENVVFENIDVKVTGQNSYFYVGAASGDLTIRKLKGRQSESIRPILLSKCSLDKLVIDDFYYESSATDESVNWILNIENTTDILKQLIIKNSTINATAGGICVLANPDGVQTIVFDNVKFNIPTMALVKTSGTATNTLDIFVNNSDISANIVLEISNKVTAHIVNSKISTNHRTCYLSDGAEAYVKSRNSNIVATVNAVSDVRKLSLKGDISTALALTTITGKFGDTLIYDNPTDQANKGIYFFNGAGTWVKIA